MRIGILADKWISDVDDGEHIMQLRNMKYVEENDIEILIVDTRLLLIGELTRCKCLKAIIRIGVGYNNLPLEYCRKRGIILAYTPNAPSRAVAEHTLALMLACLRFRDRETMGRLLRGLTVAIVGRGRIGKRLASILSFFRMSILVVDPVADTTFDEIHNIQRMDLPTALQCADIVSLHVPFEDATIDLIDQRELQMMSRKAILINTSRGGIVNEAALLKHLHIYPFFTAALDVFSHEPYGGPLLQCENCLATGHVASNTQESRSRMEREAMEAAFAIDTETDPRWLIPEREPWHENG